jgi:uncharacterized protein (TIGR02145 family)
VYGKLYNWYAVNDARGLAPEGWYIPTETEWATLGSCLGGNAVAGGPMKETDIVHWTTPNTGATNFSGFTGVPGGYRLYNGVFFSIGIDGYWWSKTESSANFAQDRNLHYSSDDVAAYSDNKHIGFSVRCIRD